MTPKTCPICAASFIKLRPLQKVCSPKCAQGHAQRQADKKAARMAALERKQTRIKLDALRTHPQLVKLAQKAFNRYIRARDEGKPCVSCGGALAGPQVGGGFDAGHYRSVGSAPHLRFDLGNVHGQCKYCNQHLAGNHVAYRAGLIARIGQAEVDRIESDQTPCKFSKEALRQLASDYRALARQTEKERT